MRNKDCQEINNSRVVWRGRSPSILNPQQRHARCEENFCGAEREQKFIHCAFAARESRRDERQRRGGSRKGDVSPFRGLCNTPFFFHAFL